MPVLSDVAQIAQVSVSTVSRTFRLDPRISEETKQKVYEAARTAGYVKPSRKDKHHQRDWGCVGLILPEVMSGYYARLVHLAADNFAQRNYSLDIRLTGFEHDAIIRHVQNLCSSNIDCLMIVIDDSEYLSDVIFSIVSVSCIPTFFITPKYMPNNDFDSIFIDDQLGVAMLIDYFAQKGFSRIGFVGEQKTLDRRDTFLDSLKRLDLPASEDLIKISPLRAEAGGYQATHEILKGTVLPDAIFYGYDQMVIGGLKAIREAGLSVPNDIAVAGYDDMVVSEYIENGITTVQSPCEDMIAIASRVLLNRLQDSKTAPQHIALRPKLVIRGTA